MYKQKKIMLLSAIYLVWGSLLFAGSTEIASGGILGILFGAFVSGLLLTFTPCVLPMVPIVSSIIAGQGKDITKTKALVLSSSYVMGTAFTYTVMGALAGATGAQLQAYFQNVWVISAMSVVFVLMALSMFGLFTIALPSAIQSRLNNQSQGIKGGNIVMVFLLGLISALILGACVSPVLISFLSVAIATSDPILGALTMFFLALGMGIPLVVVGLGAGSLLPKAGGWMDKVKYFFGVMLLAVAITIFNSLNLLPELLLIGSAYGESNMLKPLPKQVYSQNAAVVEEKMLFETITSMDALKEKLEYAIKNDKLVVIYFYTDWCPVCKKLKGTTLIDTHVNNMIKENYVALQVNMTDEKDKSITEIRQEYGIYGPPAFVFFDRDGSESDILYGYQDPSEFFDFLGLLAE
jgi:thioredoxin:protein disulfide reductase